MSSALTPTRRELLKATLALAAGAALPRVARAQAAPARMPSLYISHGSPLLAADPVRGAQLRALGAALPKPSAVLALTPHYRMRHFELGAIGVGRAGYTFPAALAHKLPPNLTYATPSNAALATRVSELLASHAPVRSNRSYFDHTTWMPLFHLLPKADVPVLELAHPYIPDAELLALGKQLAPLRDEGVLVLSSGGMTHNLAALDLNAPANTPAPHWALEFEAWVVDAVTHSDVDALLDYRARAPAVELAHPDDGDHYDVMLVALGAALADRTQLEQVSFPGAGYEGGGMSTRSIVFG